MDQHPTNPSSQNLNENPVTSAYDPNPVVPSPGSSPINEFTSPSQPNQTTHTTPEPQSNPNPGVGFAPTSQEVPQTTQPPLPSQVFGSDVAPTQGVNASSMSSSPKRKRKFTALLIVLLVLGALGGGSAFAYYGVVVPNKPENILKLAFNNTLKKKSVTVKATIDGASAGAAYKVAVTTKGNATTHVSAIDAKVTVTGVTISAEARYVDKSAYVKVKDLDNIGGLISGFAPSYAPIVTQVSDKVNNKWFEIDETILKTAKADCFLESDNAISDSDFTALAKSYTDNPFVSINSTSSDTVNGSSAIKFELTLDEKKADSFGSSLEKTSLVEKATKCAGAEITNGSGDQDISKTIKDVAGTGKMPFTIWVDKKTKTVSRIVFKTTADQEKEAGASIKLDATLDYADVTVEKPTDAKPIMSLVSELGPIIQQQPVLGASIERFTP